MKGDVMGLTFGEVIRRAVPEATEEFCEHILWGRTPFPVGRVTPTYIFRSAYRFNRACEKGITLCDFCDRVAIPGKSCCEICYSALNQRS